MAYKIRRQKPIKGGRQPLPSAVLVEIREHVERIARKYRVSKSFVIAATLADAFKIREQERYDE